MYLSMEKKKKSSYFFPSLFLLTFMVLIVKAHEEKLTSLNYAPTGSELLELMFKQCRHEDNEPHPNLPLFSSFFEAVDAHFDFDQRYILPGIFFSLAFHDSEATVLCRTLPPALPFACDVSFFSRCTRSVIPSLSHLTFRSYSPLTL